MPTPPTPVLIIPGWQNSGPEHWQTLWQRTHPDYLRVEQRDWERPVADDWVEALNFALAVLPEPPVLVAHSLGCITVAHWTSRFERPIRGALLVAPPDIERPDSPAEIVGFTPIPRARLPFPSILVASANDPYCTIERAAQFADAWGSRFVNLGACGHINVDAGFGPWPDGERMLSELLRA
jgi:predicted alpha/beta hydrolase family esterase